MAIYTQNQGGVERELRMQGTDDTNPTISTVALKGTINMTTGYDGLWTFSRQYERQTDGPPTSLNVLQSQVYGYNGLFSNQTGAGLNGFWQTWEDVPTVPAPSGFLPGSSTGNVNTSSISNIGSLSSYSFTSNITNTITALCWGDHIDGSDPTAHNNVKWVVLALDGAYNLYNNDATFKYLTIEDDSGGTVQLNRTDARFNTGENGDSTWCWFFNTSNNTVVDDLGTPTSAEIREVKFYNETSVTYKTGIAEEMTGADSENVKMSEYYKDGGLHKTTGIPTSGQIKFSDFFGKTFVSPHLSEGAFTRNYNNFSEGVYISGLNSLFQAGGYNGNSFTFQGVTAFIYSMQNNSGQNIGLTFKTSGTSTTFNANGTHDWTKMKVWAASTPLGTPLLELNRSDASVATFGAGTVNASITYTWSGTYSASTYFGTTDGASAYYIRVGT